jgi:segregation and condensation protein B
VSEPAVAETEPEDPRQDPDLLVESALFSAGDPMGVPELCEKTKLPREEVEQALETLVDAYEDRRTSLQIAKSGEKWAMALIPRFADASRHIVPPEIPLHLLRTLALIAYHQPVLQSDLQDMVGSKVYAHVGRLHDAGLIAKEREGITYELTTTSEFPEYFGIPADEPGRIREYLAERVGLLSDGGAPQTEEAADVRDAPPLPGVDPDGD